MNVTRTHRQGLVLAALLAIAGCEIDATRAGMHPPVESVRIRTTSGADMTEQVSLSLLDTTRLEVEFLDARGRPVALDDTHYIRLDWGSAAFARTDAVAESRFARDVSVIDPCAGPRSLRIGYGHSSAANERTFGPVPVVVTPEVASIRLFGENGQQLTPQVAVPFRVAYPVEARAFDCRGQRVTGLEGEYSIQPFWSAELLVHVDRPAGSPFTFRVTPLVPPGTSGQMSIGFGRGAYPAARVFGPFGFTAR
jgi:hypothetical protein